MQGMSRLFNTRFRSGKKIDVQSRLGWSFRVMGTQCADTSLSLDELVGCRIPTYLKPSELSEARWRLKQLSAVTTIEVFLES